MTRSINEGKTSSVEVYTMETLIERCEKVFQVAITDTIVEKAMKIVNYDMVITEDSPKEERQVYYRAVVNVMECCLAEARRTKRLLLDVLGEHASVKQLKKEYKVKTSLIPDDMSDTGVLTMKIEFLKRALKGLKCKNSPEESYISLVAQALEYKKEKFENKITRIQFETLQEEWKNGKPVSIPGNIKAFFEEFPDILSGNEAKTKSSLRLEALMWAWTNLELSSENNLGKPTDVDTRGISLAISNVCGIQFYPFITRNPENSFKQLITEVIESTKNHNAIMDKKEKAILSVLGLLDPTSVPELPTGPRL